MTVKGRAALNYNGRGQLAAIGFGAGAEIDFGYDAFGRRLWKRNGNEITRYLWAGDTLLCEWKEGAAAGWTRRDHLFLPGLYLPLAMRVDGEIYRQHTDHRLAPLALTGAGGNVVWSAKLKAFGEAAVGQNAIENPWRLANQYCDPETGLHYNLARYCHPSLGRFLTPDPMFEPTVGGNLYIYAAGDPINYCDPTGELFFVPILIAIGIGLVVGAAFNAGVKAYELRNQPWSDAKAREIGKSALIGGVIGAVGGAIGAAAGLGVAAVITARAGIAAASGIGALVGIGAADGAVSSAIETCAEAKAYDQALSAGDVAFNALIGGTIGAVTAGIGGMIATRLMRRAARKLAQETTEKLEREVAERLKKEIAERLEREAAEKLEREAAEKLEKEAAEKATKEAAEAEAKRIKDQIAKLKQEGHGPQRHEGDVTTAQLEDRVLNGTDPMTGSNINPKTGNPYAPPRRATRVKNEKAYVTAEANARNSPEFQNAPIEARPDGSRVKEVKLPLERSLGPDYAKEIEGVTRVGSVNNPQGTRPTSFSNGGEMTAAYVENSQGGWDLLTMFPEPAVD